METLRKALDKAEQLEQREAEPAPKVVAPPADGGAAENWEPPAYTQSRRLELDPQKLMDNRCVCFYPDAPEVEHYKILRTQIQQRGMEKGWNTFMITSALPGEGKTLTAINLALTFAKAFNQTVLLVDSDLRQQRVHEYLGFESDCGLIDYLLGERPLQDLIVWPGIEKLTVISGGRQVYESTELLGSPRMKELVHEMKSRYPDRFVFFDAPPLLAGADAMAFAPLVDGILLVVEAGRTALPDIQKALAMIPREKFIGFTLNRNRAPDKKYGYGYGYGAGKGTK
jgi:non-specific protein-tyrosine kinase